MHDDEDGREQTMMMVLSVPRHPGDRPKKARVCLLIEEYRLAKHGGSHRRVRAIH
jgi:hypothetical protein